MNAEVRLLRHPGKAHPVRIDSIEGAALAIDFDLSAGLNLRDALVQPLKRAGIEGATVRIENLPLERLHFVRPAPPKDDQHVAFYSEPHFIDEAVVIKLACATVGRKDGEPFVHCHALWDGPDGVERGGHLFTDQVIVAEPAHAYAWGLANAVMQSDFDEETNFTLFHPVAVEARAASAVNRGKRCVIARIRPNVDLTQGIEQVCRSHGFEKAIVRGSVGSIVGALFEDGHKVEDIATEILVLHGTVDCSASVPRTDLEIALIDPRGQVHKGRPKRGANPVLICFELVLEEA